MVSESFLDSLACIFLNTSPSYPTSIYPAIPATLTFFNEEICSCALIKEVQNGTYGYCQLLSHTL